MEVNNQAMNNFELTNSPAVEEIKPAPNRKLIKKRVRKVYNSACLTLLIHFVLALVLNLIIVGICSSFLSPQTLKEPCFLLIVTAISYLTANTLTYFIGSAITKKHYRAKLFGKIQTNPLDLILMLFSVIGIQMMSLMLQSAVIMITGKTGIDEQTTAMVSISDNPLQNAVLIIYTVFIAAVTEELIFRGVVLNALSVKSKVFALFASSLLFGVTHGNLNQMFNGFLLGMIFGYVALKSKSIILPMVLHIIANANAMLVSILSYWVQKIPALALLLGLYIMAMLMLGITALTLLIIRNKTVNNSSDGYPIISTIDGINELENKKGLTIAPLLKSVMFWIFMILYFGIAISSITAIA